MEEFAQGVSRGDVQIAIRLLVAAVLGAMIGYERETARKPAGLRTLTLVSIGAALFTVVSIFGFGAADPSRVAAQIVTGVGFLGAGAILREGDRMTGLTTAGSVWSTAAVGMAVGVGLFVTALVATVLILVVLRLLGKIE